MAYFANGSEGGVFDEECSTCKLGELPCPIAGVQMTYNYDAVNNKVATKILGELVEDSGKCRMKPLLSTLGVKGKPSDKFPGQEAGCDYCAHKAQAITDGFCERGMAHSFGQCGVTVKEKS